MSAYFTSWTKIALLATTFLPGFACAANLKINSPSLLITLPENPDPASIEWFEGIKRDAKSFSIPENARPYADFYGKEVYFYDFNLFNNNYDMRPAKYFVGKILPGLSKEAQTETVKSLLESCDRTVLVGRIYNAKPNEKAFYQNFIKLLNDYAAKNDLSIDSIGRFKENIGLHNALSDVEAKVNRGVSSIG